MNTEKEREAFEAWYNANVGKSLVFKTYDNSYLRRDTDEAWKSWQASANREGFVLIKNNSRTIVAIEQMVEQQVEASGITQDVFRLDGERILEAMLSAQEQSNDSNRQRPTQRSH